MEVFVDRLWSVCEDSSIFTSEKRNLTVESIRRLSHGHGVGNRCTLHDAGKISSPTTSLIVNLPCEVVMHHFENSF